jgi:hypothetical protein
VSPHGWSVSFRTTLAALLISALPSACGEGGSENTVGGDATTAAPATSVIEGDPARGSCLVTLTGDIQGGWSGSGGPTAVGSDYWQTTDDLRAQYDTVSREGDVSFDDLMARGRPVLSLLIVNCVRDSTHSLSLFPTDASTRSDVPFGPGSFDIAPGGPFGSADAGAGLFTMLMSLDADALWGTTAGSLEIIAWDLAHVVGSFRLEIQEALTDDARTGTIEGSFDLACVGSACAQSG